MKSMTGYGSAEGEIGSGRVFVEVKSVNHRYCDIQIKIPPKMNSLDPHFRSLIKSCMERGKIELFLKEKRGIAHSKDLSIDVSLARKYNRCLKKLEEELGYRGRAIHPLEVLDMKELIMIEDIGIDYSKYWNPIMKITRAAIDKMDRMRRREGAFLHNDQKARLKKVLSAVGKIEERSKISAGAQRSKMLEKLQRSSSEVTAGVRDRIDADVGFLIDKLDITEELTRLRSHLNQYGHILAGKEAVGRQLDFILQEINREINTIGSKSADAAISNLVITVKSEVEKLREQVQNIE